MKTSVFTLILMLLLQLNVIVQAAEVSCAHQLTSHTAIKSKETEQHSHAMHSVHSSSDDQMGHEMTHDMSHEMACCQDECQCDVTGCHVNYAGAIESQTGLKSHFINTLVASNLLDAPQEYLSFLFKPPINS